MAKENKNDTFDPADYDMTTTLGCSFRQTKKEALITCVAYVVWGVVMMVSARLTSYTSEVTYMFGYPTWVIWVIFVPMITWLAWSLIYVVCIFKE